MSVVLEQALDCFLVELASRDSREPRRNVSQDTVAVVGNERTLTVGTQWLLVGPTQPLGERLALPCEYTPAGASTSPCRCLVAPRDSTRPHRTRFQ